MTHTKLTRLAAILWLALAAFLLIKGISLIEGALKSGGGAPLKGLASWFGGGEVAAAFLIALGCIVGFFKGKFALCRAAIRLHGRISRLPELAPIWRLFGPVQYLLILLMMGLGMGTRALGVPSEIRGAILVAVSSALIVGALKLLRLATYGRVNPS